MPGYGERLTVILVPGAGRRTVSLSFPLAAVGAAAAVFLVGAVVGAVAFWTLARGYRDLQAAVEERDRLRQQTEAQARILQDMEQRARQIEENLGRLRRLEEEVRRLLDAGSGRAPDGIGEPAPSEFPHTVTEPPQPGVAALPLSPAGLLPIAGNLKRSNLCLTFPVRTCSDRLPISGYLRGLSPGMRAPPWRDMPASHARAPATGDRSSSGGSRGTPAWRSSLTRATGLPPGTATRI